MDYQKLVKKHYKEEAAKTAMSLTSTMADVNTRRLEMDALVSYLKTAKKALEVGCGNGAASVEIAKRVKLNLTCVDFTPELIALAKKQPTKGIKGKVDFYEQDVLKLPYKNAFDAVFTERCIINLMTWEHQKTALANMAGALKSGGRLILLEAFNDGLAQLNRSRQDVGLEPVGPAYHNFYLDKEAVIEHLKGLRMKFAQENNFLSSYFFGSRVLYPALAKANKKEIAYNSAFASYFAYLAPVGNYSQIKILVFKKT